MIYEMRTYTFHPGKQPEYLKIAEEIGRPIRGNDYGLNQGYWTSDIGTLNQIWHLWSYESLGAREELRKKLAKNDAWKNEYVANIRGLIQKQEIRFFSPTLDFKPPTTTGNIYEFRHYQCLTGRAPEFLERLKGVMPTRAKYSEPVCLWQGEAPFPNNVAHLWAYKDMNMRAEIRAKVAADPEWQAFLNKPSLLTHMENTILLPTNYSPLK